MLCIGLLGSLGGTQPGAPARRADQTAAARLRSEASSRIQAASRCEVARFGQLALEGADINELTTEASRIDGKRPRNRRTAA